MSQSADVFPDRIISVDSDRPRSRAYESEDQSDTRRFARTVWPEKAYNLAFLDVEIDGTDDLASIVLDSAAETDHWRFDVLGTRIHGTDPGLPARASLPSRRVSLRNEAALRKLALRQASFSIV